MDFKEYQRKAHETAVYPESLGVYYLVLGLTGEAGEIANKVKKEIRDGKQLSKEDLMHELGDVLWYLSEIAYSRSISLDDVAVENIRKLSGRKERGTIHGNGDER